MANISKIKLPGVETAYDIRDNSKAPLAAPQLTTSTVESTTYYPRAATVMNASDVTQIDTTDSSVNIATTAWVQAVLNSVVGYEIDASTGTLSISPLDTISSNSLTLNSTSATITNVSGDEYAFNIVV